MADCATWWLDHVGDTYMYVAATRQGDSSLQATTVEKLLGGAHQWGKLLKLEGAAKLMEEHVSFVKQLTDAAFVKDQDTVDSMVEALIANADEQTDLYEAEIPGLPKEEWKQLFLTHITATGGYILALAAGDGLDFNKNYRMAIENRNQLARLWGRLCLIMKR